jgi:epoxyqueuosine reductase
VLAIILPQTNGAPSLPTLNQKQLNTLVNDVRRWGGELGFQQIGISGIDLSRAETRLRAWIQQGWHGQMHYMDQHGSKRARPDQLVPGTISLISARMDYLPENQQQASALLDHPDKAYISRYALGRDYHKLMRKRLARLASKLQEAIGPFGHRAFVDSAPVLEKPIAQNAGLGWIGKHTNLINRDAGSWFFLGELYTDLPLPADKAASSHCGSCQACIDICPTKAIIAPYRLDARRCISYLTIEMKGTIPLEFRPAIGNRIYGCDDCQLFCPWNKFARPITKGDFAPRHSLASADLVSLFAWSENQWKNYTEGSAIRRIGYYQWLRNIAVALGNANTTAEVIAALRARLKVDSELVREHVVWALQQHADADELAD